MRIFNLVVAVALGCIATVTSVSSAAIPLGSAPSDEMITLFYDPGDGHFWMDTGVHAVTTLEVISDKGVFTATPPEQVAAMFGVYTPNKFFVLNPTGMQNEDFGLAVAPGESPEGLAMDLSVLGSIAPKGSLPAVQLIAVPEPSTLALVSLGFALLVFGKRNRA